MNGMTELLNLVGLASGVALYAMLLVMVVGAGPPRHGASRDPLLVAMAVLGLIWNVCALPVYALAKVGITVPALLVVGYTALGFLPAVVVHSVLRGARSTDRRWALFSIAVVAYGLSSVAAVSHMVAWRTTGLVPSAFAMRLLTYGYVLIVVPLAVARRGQPGERRALWAIALSIFAVSALHLSQLHAGDASWPVELLGHHASLPLAIAILYQDYPFALADLFLKRALALIAVAVAALLSVAALDPNAVRRPTENPQDVVLLVTVWVATALLYPRLRLAIGWLVDHEILKRPDYAALHAAIAQEIEPEDDIGRVLDGVCGKLTPALSAARVTWVTSGDAVIRDADTPYVLDVSVADPPSYRIVVSGLRGGRRLLSDDCRALERIATTVGRRIDSIRLAQERFDRELRERETAQLATEAELRALRAQINPHFLFNALTTIGYLIQTTPERALETLLRLTALLRGVTRSDGEMTTLGREIDLVRAYLDIEHERFEERLRIEVDIPETLRAVRVPPLIVQPIVENAVKHGIAPLRDGGRVTVSARVREGVAHPELSIVVQDTGQGIRDVPGGANAGTGVGLQNVARRLKCQYGDAATVTIASEPWRGTRVELRLPAIRDDEPSRAEIA
jgi:signal transduction histidine kinase